MKKTEIWHQISYTKLQDWKGKYVDANHRKPSIDHKSTNENDHFFIDFAKEKYSLLEKKNEEYRMEHTLIKLIMSLQKNTKSNA